MKMFVSGIMTLLLAGVIAAPLSAQEATCDDIGFDEQAVAAYPMIREACLDIIEHDGVRYAHLVARVRQAGPPSMLVMFKHRDDTWGPATRITPEADAKAYLGGEMVTAATVPAGSEVSVYLPEGRWEVAISDVADLVIAEAEFAVIEVEVTDLEMSDPEAAAGAEETTLEAAAGVEETAPEDVQEAAVEAEEPTGDDSEWLWILGLAGAFIIVWFLLRRKKGDGKAETDGAG